jgi:hypothetical protein
LRNPTSREKRARYGAPEFVAGKIPEILSAILDRRDVSFSELVS